MMIRRRIWGGLFWALGSVRSMLGYTRTSDCGGRDGPACLGMRLSGGGFLFGSYICANFVSLGICIARPCGGIVRSVIFCGRIDLIVLLESNSICSRAYEESDV